MKYQFLGEDEHVFKVKHPDGSEFSIAKSAVGPEVHKKIKSLEPIKMADGGIVPDMEETDSEKDKKGLDITPFDLSEVTTEQQNSIPQNNPLIIDPVVDLATQDSSVGRVPQSIPVQTPLDIQPVSATLQPVSGAATPQPITTEDAYATAFAQKESGIQQAANAQALASKQQAEIYQHQADQIAKQQALYQEEHAKLDAEHKQLTDAVMNQKIDPSRLWNNMSTGNKILAAISVALGGLGSGLSGKENMAMAVINKATEQDIDAQKSELGKNHTLLSENVRRYGDLNTATQATMLQMNAITQAKIAQAAARSGSAQAQAQAKMLLGDLEMQGAQIKEQLAQKQALAKGIGNVSDAQFQSLPKDVRERAVKIGGKYALAIDADSAKEAREVVGTNESMMSNLRRLMEIRKKYGSESVPGPVKAEMQTIAESLKVNYIKANKLGTLDKGVERVLDKVVSDPTSYGFVLDQYKALEASQMRSVSARLQSLGVEAGGSNQGNPEIKTVNGVKYMRGPNGEAIQVK